MNTYKRYSNSEVYTVHSTRFKEDLVEYIPSLKIIEKGRNIVLTTEDATINALHGTLKKAKGDRMCSERLRLFAKYFSKQTIILMITLTRIHK